MRSVRGAEHQFGVLEQIYEAGIALHEFDNQGDDALQNLLEAHFPHHQPADFLKKPKLLVCSLEAGLDFLKLRHLSNYKASPARWQE
jgi:hypothetical protein